MVQRAAARYEQVLDAAVALGAVVHKAEGPMVPLSDGVLLLLRARPRTDA